LCVSSAIAWLTSTIGPLAMLFFLIHYCSDLFHGGTMLLPDSTITFQCLWNLGMLDMQTPPPVDRLTTVGSKWYHSSSDIEIGVEIPHPEAIRGAEKTLRFPIAAHVTASLRCRG
jgi:hypothetical protein